MTDCVYSDFGNRIDGAKKYLYPQLSNHSGIGSWSILKSSIWPKPSIGQKDRFVEFMIFKFWDCLRIKFKTNDESEFIEIKHQLNTLKALMDAAETEDDVISILKFFEDGKDQNGVPLFSQELLLRKRLKFYEWTRSQMELEGFGLTEHEKYLIKAKSEIQSYLINDSFGFDGDILKFSVNGRRFQFPVSPKVNKKELIQGRLIFIQDLNVTQINQTVEDYQAVIEDRADMLFVEDQIKNKRRRLHQPYLEVLRHTGSNYRNNRNILPEEFQKHFNFYGGQFGNWLSQSERIKVINLAYDAFNDLATALDVDEKDISLQNRLGISFGARGSGKGCAHYDCNYHVINLTRIKGAGSLAHEWAHSLDHYLSELYGNGKNLLTAQKDYHLQSLKDIVRALTDFKSTYRLDSIALDSYEGRKKPYWSSIPEMFARAFNCYILDKLNDLNIIDDYLCYEFDISVETGKNHTARSNPYGDDRKKLNNLFDNFINELKNKKILHKREAIQEKKSDSNSIIKQIEENFKQISFINSFVLEH